MKDRVPKYPGRVKITRSDGTSEYATIERADEPVSGNEGTPLNKATLLSDDTAAMLGFTTSDDPTVDDALQGLCDTMSTMPQKELLTSIAITDGMTTLPSLQWTVNMIFKYSMLIFEFEGSISQSSSNYGYLNIYDNNSSTGKPIITLIKGNNVTYSKVSTPVVGANNIDNSQATAYMLIGSSNWCQIRTDYANRLAFNSAVSGSGTLKIYGVII